MLEQNDSDRIVYPTQDAARYAARRLHLSYVLERELDELIHGQIMPLIPAEALAEFRDCARFVQVQMNKYL